MYLKGKSYFDSGVYLKTELDRTEGSSIRFEAFLGIATIMILVGSLLPWESFGGQSLTALGSWHGRAAFIGFILTMFGTTVSYRIYRVDLLQGLRPYTDGGLGALGSLLALIGAFSFPFIGPISPEASISWGVYVTIIGGLLGLFSSYKVFLQGVASIPRGFSGEGVSP